MDDGRRVEGQDQLGAPATARKGPQQRMETFLDAHQPKFMYHATKPPVQVFSRKEIEELGPEWSETYVYQEYPKCMNHWSGKTVTVKNREEEVALGGGWSGRPGAFNPYKDSAQARPKDPDPLKWIDQWQPTLHSAEFQRKIKAVVLKAHGAFWKSPDYPSATVDSMRQAFIGIAQVLFEAGFLTQSILEHDVPDLVWDSAVSGGWWHLASETQQDIFPQKKGHHWVWLDDKRDWTALFRGETAEWIAKLLESTHDISTSNAAGSHEGRSRGPQIARKSQDDAAGGSKPDKGNMALLQSGGELKRAITLDTARRFGGVTRRAIEDAAKKGDLLTEGKRTHRRVLVSSLLEYFPPEK